MKTIDFVYGGIIVTIMVVAICVFISAFRKNKKYLNEIQSKMDGDVLDNSDLSQRDMGVQYSERPFIDGYSFYN